MKKYHQFTYLLLTVVCFTIAGCTGGYPGDERLYPVSVTVTENGSPLTDAVVVLLREGGKKIINAGGITDKNGVAIIKTDAQWDGVPEGTYKVAIAKSSSVEEEISSEEYQKLDMAERERYNQKMEKKHASVKLLVPEVIARTESTPLTIEVTPSQNNTATFDIAKY